MEKYNHKKIEEKWQRYWAEHPELYRADDESDKEKQYILDMFPYPSGDGLHVGHVESYTATDITSRYLRMNGKNVLHPQGWDAFGLPAENYAIKTKIHPSVTTRKAVATFKQQMSMMGFSYDWSRELNSSEPEYYKWTQWFFLLLYKNGLAYKAKAKVNWCEHCQTVLANEQAEGGVCERCGNPVIQKEMEQWFFKITDFIEDKNATSGLINGLDKVNWPESTKAAQKNWIGKSEGAVFKLAITSTSGKAGYEKILLATNNASKKARVEKLLKSLGITAKVLLPVDLDLKVVETDENGSLADNAKEKALAYRGETDLPILGFDTGFIIDGEANDPVKVKRNALGGYDEKNLTQAQIAELMLKYYKNIAAKRGGRVEAYFQDELALSLPDGRIEIASDRREVILTDQAKGKLDIYFPIRSLYMTKATGKYVADQSQAEELKELEPFAQSLDKLLGQGGQEFLEVFTTRLDTVFGMTYVVVAPEQPLITNYELQITNYKDVINYVVQARNKTDLERMETKEKTGVRLEGISAVNPFNGEEVPIFAADYVLAGYGTGAVMAVPAHDIRDFEFAKRYGLEIKEVIISEVENLKFKNQNDNAKLKILESAFVDDGLVINSGEYSSLTSEQAREKMTVWLEKQKLGKRQVNYKIRDWLISRQRYWGAPIPIIYCRKCSENSNNQIPNPKQIQNSKKIKFQTTIINNKEYTIIPVPEDQLPVLLPTDVDFMPHGESPLVKSKKFHDVKCPVCGGAARRESDTMDTFVCSSWYYFRYADPKNEQEFAGKVLLKKWLPVDLYVGGAEHTVLHLLYSRFFTKVLYYLGYINFDEPFLKMRHQGIILAEDGRKMSKSLGNVINPDDVVKQYGADALRLFEMFMGPLEDAKPWNTRGIVGISRFIEKIWKLNFQFSIFNFQTNQKSKIQNHKLEKLLHKTIKKVTEDIESMKFNTAISALMILVNALEKEKNISIILYSLSIILLSPFAPHLAEELWSELGNKESVFKQSWPKYNPELVKDETINLVIQVNGKVRDMIEVSAEISEEEAKKIALASEKVKKWTQDRRVVIVIFVKGKLVNIVIK